MSWGQLQGVLSQQAMNDRYERTRVPSACPLDGEPLIPSVQHPGSLHCRFDGYEWPRDGRDPIPQ